MKANFGMIVVDGRGKLGDEVASRNRHGAYLRQFVVPLNPNTTPQQEARQRVRDVNNHWISLTETQRNTWSSATPNFTKTNVFGKVYKPSGYQLHQSLNMNLLLIGEPLLIVPPIPNGVLWKQMQSLQWNTFATGLNLFIGSGNRFGSKLVIYATPPLSPGKNFVKSEFRKILITSAVNGNILIIQSSYVSVFGEPTPGQKVFVYGRYVNRSTGQSRETKQVSLIIPS